MSLHSEQLSFDTTPEPTTPQGETENIRVPDFSGVIRAMSKLPELDEEGAQEEEVIRRNTREDTLLDHANFNPKQAAKTAGTIIQPREFRKPISRRRRPFSPRELARGDKGTDFNTQ